MTKLDLKLYRGYLNDEKLVVFGHVFKSWAPDKYKLDRRGIYHAFSVIHMFRIKPLKNQEVTLRFKGIEIKSKTENDGFFKFEIPFHTKLESGWHEFEVVCKIGEFGIIGKGEVLKPYDSKFGIISDIDDTFLVSHSKSFFKKLYIMLFKNVNKRKAFIDVTPHYQALSRYGQTKETAFNSFFYVSSSEYNLYDFIIEFTQLHKLPKAVILLKKIKTGILDFFKTGRGSHDHKFHKIDDLISFYPNIEYILLGDDSQHDAFIYERICRKYQNKIKAIYIRQIGNNKKSNIQSTMESINKLNVATCYFKGSSEAIKHSKEIGVI
ncbi:App1 family protein [Brumimicrobium mesophilum]|uniref:App1 family protein n=1 Tax=Brumimicrobium mesophilum TaxID=392717 RepID=UPI000D140D3F|nr:App1 family protein [Brumimicrobium mesophilum]